MDWLITHWQTIISTASALISTIGTILVWRWKTKVQHKFDVARLEHQMRFDTVYNHRFKEISELHANLTELAVIVKCFTLCCIGKPETGAGRKEIYDDIWPAFSATSVKFNGNRLFLSKDVDEDIFRTLDAIRILTNRLHILCNSAGVKDKGENYNLIGSGHCVRISEVAEELLRMAHERVPEIRQKFKRDLELDKKTE